MMYFYKTIPEIYIGSKHDWSSDYYVVLSKVPIMKERIGSDSVLTAIADLTMYYEWLEKNHNIKFPNDATHWLTVVIFDFAKIRFYFRDKEIMTHFALRWI